MKIEEAYTIFNAKRLSAGRPKLSPEQFLIRVLDMFVRGKVGMDDQGNIWLIREVAQ